MARGMPSLAALLGLVAIAGYQNRDKIGEFVKGLTGSNSGGTGGGGLLDTVTKSLGSAAGGANISGGLGELIDQFRNSGQGETADSWVSTGPNAPVNAQQMEKALGPDMIDGLARQTGLSREELLDRLTKVLPEAVDKMTPNGRLPA